MDFIIENSLGAYLFAAAIWIGYNTNKKMKLQEKKLKLQELALKEAK